MKRIPLGRDNLFALIDDSDIDLASISWYAHKSNSGFYAAHREGSGARERVWLHTLVLERMLDRCLTEDELADHINRDKLDCRRENLRLASRSQNNLNTAKVRGKSKYKGVSPYRGSDRDWETPI